MSYATKRDFRLLARATFVLALTALPCAAALGGDDPPALYHAFQIAPKGAWGTVSLSFDSGWHIGSIDGPLVNPLQMRDALAGLTSVTIGARCVGQRDGPTHYPCGFAMAQLEIDGISAERLIGIAARGPTLSFTAEETLVSSTATPLVQITASVPELGGDIGARFGGRMTFRWRSVSSQGHQSKVDTDSGVVEMRYRAAPGYVRRA